MSTEIASTIQLRRIAGWVRQTKLRSKRYGCIVDIHLHDVLKIYEEHGYKCGYCGNEATSPDHPFPVSSKAPCVIANILPCCEDCKILKKNRDLLWFWRIAGRITREQCSAIIAKIVARGGGPLVKAHIRQLYQQENQ